jgi:cytochrome c nitrite reductase small subunit
MKIKKDTQLLVLSILLGISFGLGVYTFIYAKGFSYLSDNPQACRSCHVMNKVFEDWMKGGHQHVAGCNDCHVPAGFIGKMLIKSINGFNHSFAFTFLNVPIAIRPTSGSSRVVQDNCIRCHGGMATHAIGGPGGGDEPLQCVTCHREAGHRH